MKRVDTAKLRILLNAAEVDGPEYVVAFDEAMRRSARQLFDELDEARDRVAKLESLGKRKQCRATVSSRPMWEHRPCGNPATYQRADGSWWCWKHAPKSLLFARKMRASRPPSHD